MISKFGVVAEYMNKFYAERNILAELNKAKIKCVLLMDYFASKDNFYIIIEHPKGKSLKD